MNVLAKRFSTSLHPTVLGVQQESAELAAVVEETVSGVRVVKGFGAERVQAASCATEADDVYERSIERGPDPGPLQAGARPAARTSGLIAVLGYGGHLVLDGRLTLGDARRVQRLRRTAHLAAADARA